MKKSEELIIAKGIKNRKERITYIYDKCCKKLDNFYKGKNYCQFKNNQCIAHQYESCPYQNGCCGACIYQSNKGCTTSNLTCKLYYCTQITNHNKVLTEKDLPLLKLLTIRQRIILRHDYFSKREDVLTDLYLNSLIIFSIRMIIRIIKGNYRLKRRYGQYK